MCDICKKHGDGTKWYLNPKNYSREMGEAKRDFLEKIAGRYYEEWMIGGFETIDRFKNIPILNKLFINLGEKYEEKMHGGQVVTLDDALKVLELCENPALLPCECRRIAGEEHLTCLNFGLIPELYEKANPEEYIEELTLNKAKTFLSEQNKKGMYHLILWSKAPYITTVCNCTTTYCTAYKGRLSGGTKTTIIKGEYVSRINGALCNGCKTCLTRCPFGAIAFDLDKQKAFVNIRKCFGCGLCETGCNQKAIELIERKITPAKNLW